MKVASLRVENFRGFINSGDVKLKPLNFLIGKNSIGKSSFGRLWPLLHQGIQIGKRSPIVWNGDLVDFGSFDDVLSRYSEKKNIIFNFTLTKKQNTEILRRSFLHKSSLVKNLINEDIDVSLSLCRGGNEYTTLCSSFSIKIGETLIQNKFDKESKLESITINGVDINLHKSYITESRIGYILPEISYFVKINDQIVSAHSPMRMRLFRVLRDELHSRLTDERVHEICSSLKVICNKEELIEICRNLQHKYKTWQDFLKKAEANPKLLARFHEAVNFAASEYFSRDLDSFIKDNFSSVNYIKPFRATAQRYYRRQDLAIDNIDSNGSNLAFYLESLSTSKLEKLNLWLSDNLDLNVILDSEKGHVMIKIHDLTSNRIDNMADMGFGFSQVLPLAVQAWISSSIFARQSNRIDTSDKILVWEQPELHLHPAMQRKLTSLIAKTIKAAQKSNISFIIETHSQSMINEIGDLILENELKSDDVQILLFEQTGNNSETTIRSTGFNSDGELINWPFGFLAV
ncbi:AAA family ATPase [Chitinibacter sp. FCG-7]|uniref:AAA family ATPase n=1 Tax=Chitinibacter mangrovi TaxID=3153927 RepID=A0AAU7FBK5_9NEIS